MWVRVFNATFNNISVISWRSVLLVEETGILLPQVTRRKTIDLPNVTHKFDHIMYLVHLAMSGI